MPLLLGTAEPCRLFMDWVARSAATVREQLDRWDATVDVTVIALPPGLPWPRIEATVRAAAPPRPGG
jgi:hypothetical protein